MHNLEITPDIKISVHQTFGIDSEMQVDGFSKKNKYVPDLDKSYNSSLFFEKVMDERQMPTIFLNSEIEKTINNKDEPNLFLLILVSLNNKEWIEIHPEHLKLVLKGIKKYKNSELLKNTLLNIFENNKIF